MKSAFDLLIDYAVKSQLPYSTHKDAERFYTDSRDGMSRTQYVFFKTGSLIYYAFDSYSSAAFTSRTHCGVYRPAANQNLIEFRLYKRDCLDRFLRYPIRKTGDKNIDRYFTITSKSPHLPPVFSDRTIELFQGIREVIQPLYLIVSDDHLPAVSELQGKRIIGLETNHWIYKHSEIDLLIENARALFDTMAL